MSDKFGPVSLSELTFYVNRAAFGAGCYYGVADDITAVAVSLAKKNDDPTILLSKAFDNIANKTVDTKLSKVTSDQETIFTAISENQVSAISAGIAISDFLKMQSETVRCHVLIKDVDLPALLILCLKALSEDVTIETIEVSMQSGFQKIECSDVSACSDIQSGDVKLTLTNQSSSTSAKIPAINDHHNIAVSQEGWNGIRKHFNNSLVLATEESRLSGAGAGVIDTD